MPGDAKASVGCLQWSGNGFLPGKAIPNVADVRAKEKPAFAGFSGFGAELASRLARKLAIQRGRVCSLPTLDRYLPSTLPQLRLRRSADNGEPGKPARLLGQCRCQQTHLAAIRELRSLRWDCASQFPINAIENCQSAAHCAQGKAKNAETTMPPITAPATSKLA